MMPTTPTASRVISTSTPGTNAGEAVAGDAQRLAGEEVEDLRGARRLAQRLGQRLAFLARQQVARARRVRAAISAEMRINASWRASGVGARPGGKGGSRRGDGGVELGGARLGVEADDVVGVGRVDVARDALAVRPFAADEVLVQCRSSSTDPLGAMLSAAQRQIKPRRARLRISAPDAEIPRRTVLAVSHAIDQPPELFGADG